MKKDKKNISVWGKIFFGVFSLILFLYWGNNSIETTEYKITLKNWPSKADGYKIVHLSDLQSKDFGKEQKPIVDIIKREKPDLIVMTGDLIDRNHYAKEPAIALMAACVKIAPTAYVTGNHEISHGSAKSLKDELDALGVLVMDDKHTAFPRKNPVFNLIGISDFNVFRSTQKFSKALSNLSTTNNALPKILLSHRPERFVLYKNSGYDLTLSGHSHGGQIRLPFIGGLYAPNQGFLPKYDGGYYQNGKAHMVVSRGLGNSIFPLRILNRPEIPVITLYSQ